MRNFGELRINCICAKKKKNDIELINLKIWDSKEFLKKKSIYSIQSRQSSAR